MNPAPHRDDDDVVTGPEAESAPDDAASSWHTLTESGPGDSGTDVAEPGSTEAGDPEVGGARSSLAWTEMRTARRGGTRGGRRPPWRRHPVRIVVVVVVVLALFAAGGTFAWVQFRPQIAAISSIFGGGASKKSADYAGSGTTSVDVTITQGQSGSDIAKTLQKRGVTKSYGAFYDLLLATSPSPVFQPGVWSLKKKMSAAAALDALQNKSNRLSNTAVIPEGLAETKILPRLAAATKIPEADLTAAAGDLASFGVPAEARNLDGFLFPATYQFTPGLSAHDVLKKLVDRSFQAYDQAGVAPADRFRVATFAALVQKEAGSTADMPKVARVFQNRLDKGMLLQSDATVAYGAGLQTVFTTDAQRADASNAYNTYVHPGLPVGPIGNPGDAAIQAVLAPAPGPWLFFTAVNLQTGQTVFSTTDAEHSAAVARLQAWCTASPANNAYCK